MQSQKAGLRFATRARKRELSIQDSRYVSRMTWIENFLSQSFSENHFSPRFMLPCSLLAENIFSVFFSKYLFRIENVLKENILKVFLETTLVHVSCYPDHYEPKIIFSIFEVRNYPSIYDFGLEVSPENAISEGRPTLCNSS